MIEAYYKYIFKSKFCVTPIYNSDLWININDDIRSNDDPDIFFVLFDTKATKEKIFRSKELQEILNGAW